MSDLLRPRLAEGTQLRERSDGTFGLHHPATGRALEVAADQASLLRLLDGARSLPEIAAEHLHRHGHVPFGALRDLLRSLAQCGLLGNGRAELEAAGLVASPRWMQRLAGRPLVSLPLPAGGLLSGLGALAFAVAAVVGVRWPAQALTPADVLLAYAGAALALSARGFAKAAVASALGAPPSRLQLSVALGVLHLTPDHATAALLNRGARACAYLAALGGAASAMAIGASRPGLWTGALVVLLVDLCSFAPTSAGRLLATAFGKVDLREHVRAYLSRRLLRRVTSTRFFAGEGSLIVSALLSLAWISLVVRLLLTQGVVGVLSLLAAGLDVEGPWRGVAYAGAGLLAALIPASLLLLAATLGRALLSLRPPAVERSGEGTGAVAGMGEIPLFSTLPANELAALAQAARELRYRPGWRIVVQGAAADRFFAIRSGEAVVEVEDDSGLAREVARLGPGDCFGESALLDGGVRTASVRPVRETVVAALGRADFDRVRKSFTGIDLSAVLRATSALGKSRYFAQLTPERRGALGMKLKPREAKAGETLVKKGERGDLFYLVGAGQVEVLDDAGAQVGVLGPGDHFGEVALLTDGPRTATVRALTDATLLTLPKDAFVEGIAADLRLSEGIERLAAERSEARR
ncbi:MAG: cyclic nucleotide-binding domain-containing protein [Myxococcaceae bacterium]